MPASSSSSSSSLLLVVPLLCLLAGAAAGAALTAAAAAATAAGGSAPGPPRLKLGKEGRKKAGEGQHTENKEAREGANEAAAAAAAAPAAAAVVAAEATSILSLWFDGGQDIESNYRHRWFCAPGSVRQLAFDKEVREEGREGERKERGCILGREGGRNEGGRGRSVAAN